MNKQEFKKMFKELFKSGEISLSVEWSNDGYQHICLYTDNERIVDTYIDKD